MSTVQYTSSLHCTWIFQHQNDGTNFCFDQVSRVTVQTAGQPRLQTLGKVPNSLCESAGNGTEDFWNQEVHDALVEDIIAGVEEVYHRLAAREQE